MSAPFLIIIYKVFTNLMSFFTWIILIIRTIRKKEEWIRRKERFGIVDINRKSNNYIWFHAASVGELLSIQPLVKKLLNAGETNMATKMTNLITVALRLSTCVTKHIRKLRSSVPWPLTKTCYGLRRNTDQDPLIIRFDQYNSLSGTKAK